MGYKTFESIGRELPGRINIVINRDCKKVLEDNGKIYYTKNLDEILNYLSNENKIGNYFIGDIFVIGGEKIYNEALHHPKLLKVYLTKINKKIDGDRNFKIRK